MSPSVRQPVLSSEPAARCQALFFGFFFQRPAGRSQKNPLFQTAPKRFVRGGEVDLCPISPQPVKHFFKLWHIFLITEDIIF